MSEDGNAFVGLFWAIVFSAILSLAAVGAITVVLGVAQRFGGQWIM